MVFKIKGSDFGYISKTGKCFLSGIKSHLRFTGVQISSYILGYLRSHRRGDVFISGKDGVSSGDEFGVLCD
jgi:hypothetical protein